MKNILLKLAAIRNDIEPLAKDGRNEKQNYGFLSDKQITQVVGELLQKHNVLVTHSDSITTETQYQTANGSTMFLITIKLDYAFNDVDTGEKVEGSVVGQGADTGDKGVYKAITGAFKYLYVKTFNIPVADDPERDNYTYHQTQNLPPRSVQSNPNVQTTTEVKELAEKIGGTVVPGKMCTDCGKLTGSNFPKCKICYYKK